MKPTYQELEVSIRKLKKELKEKKQDYASLTEKYESQNEELQSINEELQNKNNELDARSRKLKKFMNLYKSILATVPDIIMEVNTNKKYTWANEAGYKFFGEDVIGKEASFYFEGEQDTYKTVEPLFNGSEDIINVESWQRRADGESRLLAWWFKGLKDNDGKVKGALSTARDITEQKKSEKKLKEMNTSMEEMISITSHDLQTPLVTMDVYAGELLDNYKDKLDEDGIYCLKRLKVNAQRMHILIQSLLDISRLSTKKFPYRTINTNTLVKNIIKELLLIIDKTGANINIKKMPGIIGDKQRIESVFRNLVTNAINYGGKNISIGYKKNTFYIKDDGIGIPENQLKRIFTPGERLKMIEVEGAGMGLTFCKKVVEQHDGKIWAESEGGGKGTTVLFTIPVK